MNKSPRTKAIEQIISDLEKQMQTLNYEIRQFKSRQKQLIEEQTVKKRKRAEIWKLIRALRDNKEEKAQ